MARKISRRILAQYVGDQLLAGVSEKKVAEQLAAHLIETRRTKELDVLISDIEYYLADKGTVSAIVTSAFTLSAATDAALKAKIKSQTGAQHITIEHVIDSGVLGGMKLALPGRELDTTIARKLSKLRTEKA